VRFWRGGLIQGFGRHRCTVLAAANSVSQCITGDFLAAGVGTVCTKENQTQGDTAQTMETKMINLSNITAGLALSLVVTSTTLSLAASRNVSPGHNARAQAIEQIVDGDVVVSTSRARALRECNERAGKLTEYTWGVRQSENYQACMAEHGEIQ